MKNKIGLIIIVLVALGVGYYIYSDYWKNSSAPNVSVEDNSATTTITKNGITFEIPKGSNATIEEIPISPNIPIPNLDRTITFSSLIPDESKSNYTAKITTLVASLKKDPSSMQNWLMLGIFRKAIGDYTGTIEAWVYAGEKWPKTPTSFGNLGDLYAYYIKDNVKAEQYFLKAIAVDPNSEFHYIQTATFYNEVVKDSAKAKNILEKGLKILPTSDSIKKMLDSLNQTN